MYCLGNLVGLFVRANTIFFNKYCTWIFLSQLTDHDNEIQPDLPMEETSEYRSTINKLEVSSMIMYTISIFMYQLVQVNHQQAQG